jgi:hypothetical protein
VILLADATAIARCVNSGYCHHHFCMSVCPSVAIVSCAQTVKDNTSVTLGTNRKPILKFRMVPCLTPSPTPSSNLGCRVPTHKFARCVARKLSVITSHILTYKFCAMCGISHGTKIHLLPLPPLFSPNWRTAPIPPSKTCMAIGSYMERYSVSLLTYKLCAYTQMVHSF